MLVRGGSALLDAARTLVVGRVDPVWRPGLLGTVVLRTGAVVGLAFGLFALVLEGVHPLVAIPLSLANTGAAVLVVYRPLVGWRLSVLSMLISPLIVLPSPATTMLALPWTQFSAVQHLFVVLVLALSVPGRVTALVVVFDAVVVFAVMLLPVGPVAAATAAAGTALVVGVLGGLGTAQRASTTGLRDARRGRAEERDRRSAVEDRARIARELHDVVAHHLSAIAVRAESAPHRVSGSTELAAELQAVAVAAREALTDMRRLLGVLRDGDTDRQQQPAPDLDGLGELVAAVRASGVDVALEVRGRPRSLPPAVGLVGYRVAQEALSNASRHAAGAPTSVLLHWLPSAVRLQVENGPGAGEPAGEPGAGDAGHGLTGMRERVAAVGGLLVAGPQPDGGYLIDMTVTT